MGVLVFKYCLWDECLGVGVGVNDNMFIRSSKKIQWFNSWDEKM